MTDELQRPAGGLTEPAAFTGSIESLGFTSGEASSAPAIVLPAAEVALTSRRALREAERAATRRSGRPAPAASALEPAATAPAVFGPVTPTRSPAPAFVAPDVPAPGIAAAAPVAAAAPSGRRAHGAVQRPAPRPQMRHGVQASRLPLIRRIAQRALPPTVMVAVAGLLIGTTVPANALLRPSDVAASAAIEATRVAEGPVAEPSQVLEMSANVAAAPVATRDDWTVTSYVEVLRAKYGNRDYSYTTTGVGAVRWPFPFASPVSSGFGQRVSPCRGCSSNHRGTDFTPGDGTPIQVVADGVVSSLDEGWSFGEHVFIDSVVNGQNVTILYAHMQEGSSPLVPGQVVSAGDFVGLVGNSGASTGPHLHLETRIDGIPVDSFAWLLANAS